MPSSRLYQNHNMDQSTLKLQVFDLPKLGWGKEWGYNLKCYVVMWETCTLNVMLLCGNPVDKWLWQCQ